MAWTQEDKDRIRFTPQRYSFRGTSAYRPSEYVPQLPGMYAFPSDNGNHSSSSSSESSEQTPLNRSPVQGLPLLPVE